MKSKVVSAWLWRLAERRVAVALAALAMGAILIAIGLVSLMLGRSPGEPLNLGGLAWIIAVAALVAGLIRQALSQMMLNQTQSRVNAELEQTNAALNESVAASRAMRQEMARQKMLAENLLAVARATGQRPVLEATLQNTLSICVTLTGATHGALFLVDANGRVTRHLLAKPDAPAQEARTFVGKALAEGVESWAIKNRQVARAADTLNDFRWVGPSDQVASTRSAMAIPLMSREAIVGVITLMHSSPGHFTDEHERLLTDAADQVAVALDNARIFDTMTRLTDRLSLLYEVSQTATQLDLDLALEQVVRAIRSSTGWPTVAAFLLDSERKPVTQTSVGHAAQAILDYRLPSGESLVAQAISSAQVARACNGAAVIVAPIRIGPRLLGVLGVYSEQADGFSDQDQELVSSVADTLAMAAAYAEVSRR